MKKYLIIIIVSVYGLSSFAQSRTSSDDYYYSSGEKVYWNAEKSALGIKFNDVNNFQLAAKLLNDQNEIPYDVSLVDADNMIIVYDKSKQPIELSTIKGKMPGIPEHQYFVSEAKIINGLLAFFTGDVLIKLSDTNTFNQHILKMCDSNEYQYIGDNTYCISFRTEEDLISFANLIYLVDGVIYSCPNFLSEVTQDTYDEYYHLQWNLDNNGMNNNRNGIDIKAPEAWDFINRYAETVDSSIIVAILDDGIVDHEDFHYPNGESKLLHGYSPNGGDGAPCNGCDHGQLCAGVIGSVHNNIGIAGVSPLSKLVSVRVFECIDVFGVHQFFNHRRVRDAINYAWSELGVDVINCSWHSNDVDIITDAFNSAATYGRNGNGCIIIASSANYPNIEYTYDVHYPAKLSNIIAVGAIDTIGARADFSCHGENLELVAPGINIPSTDREGFGEIGSDGLYDFFSGTSASAPMVSGVAALILSVNPNLTAEAVRKIMENTATKARSTEEQDGLYAYANNPSYPNGTWNREMGYGLVNAHMSVVRAMGYNVDLFTNDFPNQNGPISGNVTVGYNSPDIWVRHNQDNGTTHQSANAGAVNYVYVRIHNGGSTASYGNDVVKLYKKNSTPDYGSWPADWIVGGQATIPSIPAGGETIVCIPTYFPNNNCEFSLLTRIVSDFDDYYLPETENTMQNIRLNNNVSVKNVVVSSVVIVGPDEPTPGIVGSFSVSNPSGDDNGFDLGFSSESSVSGNSLHEEAEISLVLEENLLGCWIAGGERSRGLRRLNDSTFLVLSENAMLQNLVIPANATYKMKVVANFLTDEHSNQQDFMYEISQYDGGGELMGILGLEIDKPERVLFSANAGENLIVDRNASYSLNAESIGESAHYRWYDESGTLVADGQNIEAIATEAKTFRLEVIADADGYKDYDTVSVSLTPSKIISISPNPTHNNTITVEYNIIDVSSAMIVVTNISGSDGVTRSYQLGTSTSSKTIDITNYAQGAYSISLVCDGAVVDSKQFLRL